MKLFYNFAFFTYNCLSTSTNKTQNMSNFQKELYIKTNKYQKEREYPNKHRESIETCLQLIKKKL